ncbi:hypothetical protein DL93DRAFT_2150986 [Clavulina sp. PMI_390]|nr:hypothetical protein DL93DRAFT_2150986 [Clavulina sp. PMI_390]
MQTIKCVAVGDPGVGKTCLMITYCTNTFRTESVPSVFDNNVVTAMIGDTPYSLHIYDTTTDGHYERLRPLSYPMTDVFLICFSIASPESFENVKDKWFPEVHHHCPHVACLLVGTKVDLRADPKVVANLAKKNQSTVAKTDGEKLAKDIRAYRYIEVSALIHYGVTEVFNEAIVAAINHPRKPRSRGTPCVVL